MKNKGLTALLLVTAILSGCAAKTDVKSYTPPTDMETDEHTPEDYTPEESEPQEELEEPIETEIIEHTEVEMKDNKVESIQIADMIYEQNRNENTMFSPLSLNLALGLLLEGSEGQSDSELNAFLGEGYSSFAQNYIKNVVPKYNETWDGYDEWDSGYATAFEIANSVWIKDDYTISDEYKDKVESKYNAEVGDFSVKDVDTTVEKINGWCSEKTHNLIDSIVARDNITEDLAAMLINSVYLESGWVEPWDILYEYGDEKHNVFTDFEGNKIDTQLIYKDFGVYYENDKATAFSAPYMNGMQFIGILPKETGEFTLDSLDIPGLISNRDYNYDIVHARMPKLNFETSANLNEMLIDKGMGSIFDVQSQDFLSMTADNAPIHVDKVIQKTKIELDENGTKAAAVTAIMMADNASIMEPLELKEVEVYLDRPFAFVIYDSEADQIVFIGKVVNVNMGE